MPFISKWFLVLMTHLRKFSATYVFAYDVIIIIRVSRVGAKYCRLCSNIYKDLTGQDLNLRKTTFYVSSWGNRRLSTSTGRILNMNSGSFPFKYLGAYVSPSRLNIKQWNFLLNIVNLEVSTWNHNLLSQVGKIVYINSYLISTPIYQLFAFIITDLVIVRISKVPRDFLWAIVAMTMPFYEYLGPLLH